MRYALSITNDHFQFYLEDAQSAQDTSDIWDDAALDALVAVAPGLIGVSTARYGGIIAVEVEIHATRPTLDMTEWDQVVECGIDVTSGQLLVTHPEGSFSDAPKIRIPPAMYRVLVCFGNIRDVVDTDAVTGDDRYRIILWPDGIVPPHIVKLL